MPKPTQSLMLGDVNIGQYVIRSDITAKRLKDIKAKVAELKEDCRSSERILYNQLYSEMISAEYPQIDLSFLEKSSNKKIGTKINHKGFLGLEKFIKEVYIKIPAFSVYPFYGINEFSIEIESYNVVEINNRKKILPIEIESRLLKSLGASEISIRSDVYGGRYYYTNKPHNGNIQIKSEFNGLIPLKTKEKVKKSLEHFDEQNICIITETKPEKWGVGVVRQITRDPLIIGLIGDNANIIDHFDTTPLENLVKDTYLKNKLS